MKSAFIFQNNILAQSSDHDNVHAALSDGVCIYGHGITVNSDGVCIYGHGITVNSDGVCI